MQQTYCVFLGLKRVRTTKSLVSIPSIGYRLVVFWAWFFRYKPESKSINLNTDFSP